MRTLILIAFIFPLVNFGQVFVTQTGPPIYISKKYIADHKIRCLTFSETRGHSKNKPYSSANYSLAFDSSGTLTKMKWLDTLMFPADPNLYLLDDLDTMDLKKYDSVIYNKDGRIIKKTKYEHKEYYTYDSKGRLSQITNITPQPISLPSVDITQFKYDEDGKLLELVMQKGKVKSELPDITVYVHSVYSYVYINSLLTSIRYSSYKGTKIDYSYEIHLEYTNGIIFKIVHEDKKLKDYLNIGINQCK